MKTVKVRLTFLEECLGTASADERLHSEYIASKAPDAPSREEEIAAIGVDAAIKESMTVFPKEDGKPFFWDYQIRGFFKDACGALQRWKGEAEAKESLAIKAYKKVIDGCIFVEPRKIMIGLAGEIGSCERSLRAETAQGARTALAHSETIPAGSTIEFEVECPDKYEAVVREWLNYGRRKGLGQWRNSGKGRFSWEEVQS